MSGTIMDHDGKYLPSVNRGTKHESLIRDDVNRRLE